MKTNKIIGIIGLLLASQSDALAEKVGNGGDIYAQEYVAIASKLHEAVCIRLNILDSLINCAAFKEKIDSVKVVTAKVVFGGDGKERDAINNRETNTITVSRMHWGAIVSPDAKLANVIHEYAALMMLEGSDDYNVSNQVISLLRRYSIDLAALASVNVLSTERIEAFNRGNAKISCDSGEKDEFSRPIYLSFYRGSALGNPVNESRWFIETTTYAKPFLNFKPGDNRGSNVSGMSYQYDFESGVILFTMLEKYETRGGYFAIGYPRTKVQISAVATQEDQFEVLIEMNSDRAKILRDFDKGSLGMLEALEKKGWLNYQHKSFSLRLKNCILK